MPTTIRIDDELFARTKAEVALTGRTLGSVIEDAVRLFLDRGQVVEPEVPPLVTFGRGGLRPGIDRDDGALLREVMDGEGSI